MAQIPRRDIPQTPGTSLGPLDQTPGTRVNLAGVASQAASAPMLDAAPFVAESLAVAQAGQEIGSTLAAALGTIAQQGAEARNRLDIATGRSAMSEVYASFEEWKQQNPDERTWGEEWENRILRDVKRIAGNPNLSQVAREELLIEEEGFAGRTRIQVARDAYKQTFAKERALYEGQMALAIEQGDEDGAVAAVDALEQHGHAFPGEAEVMRVRARGAAQDSRDRQQWEAAVGDATADPLAARASLEQGSYADFDPTRQRALRNLIDAEIRMRADEEEDNAIAAIMSGDIATPEQIERAGAHLEEEPLRMERLKQTLARWQAQQADAELQAMLSDPGYVARELMDLETEVLAFDERFDRDKTKRVELQMRLKQIEPFTGPERQAFYQKLVESKSISPNDTVRSRVFSELGRFVDDGRFGPIDREIPGQFDTRGQPMREVDPLLLDQATMRESSLRDQFRAWHSANPQASETEALEWLHQAIRTPNAAQAAGAILQGANTGNDLLDAVTRSLSGYGALMEDPYEAYRLSRNPILERHTTYYAKGVEGDEMTDKWTERGYTSTGPNLVEGVAAVNPAVYPLGSILRNEETGELFLAGDRHGNKDKAAVDVYAGKKYPTLKKQTGAQRWTKVGQIPRDQIPTTREGVQALLEEWEAKGR